jgi:hypothetical protein
MEVSLVLSKEYLENSFLLDVIRLEAKDLLKELKENKLEVILIPAPNPQFEGHMIRVSQNRNPNWYKKLYYSSGEKLKRNWTVQSLSKISENKIRWNSKYDIMILEMIYERLQNGIGNEM